MVLFGFLYTVCISKQTPVLCTDIGTTNDLQVALIQLATSEDKDANLHKAELLVEKAVEGGAKIVALPVGI